VGGLGRRLFVESMISHTNVATQDGWVWMTYTRSIDSLMYGLGYGTVFPFMSDNTAPVADNLRHRTLAGHFEVWQLEERDWLQ
jgi:hypothetical protein